MNFLAPRCIVHMHKFLEMSLLQPNELSNSLTGLINSEQYAVSYRRELFSVFYIDVYGTIRVYAKILGGSRVFAK